MEKIRITSIDGNGQKLDGGSMFGNAPRPVWERWIQPDNLGRIPLACRSMLVEIDDKKILCETGIGAFFDPKMADRFGVQNADTHLLSKKLAEHGIDHSEIDYVILTHLHFDHAGGLLPSFTEIKSGNDQLLFSNAKYVVGKEAFARAKEPHFRDRASFIPGLVEKLESSGRLIIVDGDGSHSHSHSHADVIPEKISFTYSNGHTPGQMLPIIQGNSKKIIFTGDLIPGVPWIHLPITMGYDRYPELLIDEKQDLYNKAKNEDWLFFFTHDPVTACASIHKNEKGKYSANEKYETLDQFAL